MDTVTRKTYDEVMMPLYNPFNMVLVRGRGVYLYDTEDNEYLDLFAGIAALPFGHSDPGLIEVIKKQAFSLMQTSNFYTNDKVLMLAKKLTALTGLDRAYFGNSGAEANEAALKLARRYAYDVYGEDKNEIISCDKSFHGRTFFTMNVGGSSPLTEGFGPKPAAITHVPFNNAEELEKHISDKTCAVLIEPIQGEAGIIPAETEFLQKARQLCNKYNALLIFDEVQCGMGRSGYLYVYQSVGVKPDILTTAKALAGSLPFGSMLAIEEVAKHFTKGLHGSTFGGNPFACACACYTLDTVSKPDFLSSVKQKGKKFVKVLENLNAKYDIFSEIRGRGLMLGCVLKEPYFNKADELLDCCVNRKVLLLTATPNVLRLLPALNITDKEIEKAEELLDLAFADFKLKNT